MEFLRFVVQMRPKNREMSRLCIEKHDAPLDMTGSFVGKGGVLSVFASQGYEQRRRGRESFIRRANRNS